MIPDPAPRSVAAFNEAMCLFGDHVDELRRLQWRLSGLVRRNGSDSAALLGLIHVESMLGNRDAAVSLTNEAFGKRHAMSPEDRSGLATLAAALGLVDQALQLASEPSQSLPPFVAGQLRRTLWDVAFTTWDPALLASLRAQDDFIGAAMIAELDSLGALPALRERHALANAVLLPLQCGLQLSISTDGERPLTLIRVTYVAGDTRRARDVQDALIDVIGDFDRAYAGPVADGLDLVSDLVLPVAGRLAMGEGVAAAAA